MPNEQLNLRITPSLAARLDEVEEQLRSELPAGVPINRSVVVKVLLEEALRVREEKQRKKPK